MGRRSQKAHWVSGRAPGSLRYENIIKLQTGGSERLGKRLETTQSVRVEQPALRIDNDGIHAG